MAANVTVTRAVKHALLRRSPAHIRQDSPCTHVQPILYGSPDSGDNNRPPLAHGLSACQGPGAGRAVWESPGDIVWAADAKRKPRRRRVGVPLVRTARPVTTRPLPGSCWPVGPFTEPPLTLAGGLTPRQISVPVAIRHALHPVSGAAGSC